MVESLQTSAQLTTVVEVDVTRIARLREPGKADFERREGVKLSFLPFFAIATVEALKQHPKRQRVDRHRGRHDHLPRRANYVARRFGVVSAMSCAEALRRCPTAVFVRPRMAVYREYSREVWSIVREVVPTVEQAGIDEGYLDLGEIAPAFDDARALAEAVRAVVRARTRLSCSLGVATSKVVAKVASDRRKPGGLTVVRPGREAAFLAPFPIRVLPGIGPRSAARLAAAGVETIGDLAAIADRELARILPGKVGRLAPRPCARHRSAAARGLDRADLDLERGDLRARCRRRRAAARRAAPDGRPPRGAPA